MRVFLVEMETVEPVVIAAKKGKSRFVEGLKYIPASSIAGAIARNIVLENILNSLGNCRDLASLNRTPDCANCTENCLYRRLWIDRKVKITNGVLGEWDLSSPGISNLQTVCEPRLKHSKDFKMDFLLELLLERMLWLGKAKAGKIKNITEIGYKKIPSTYNGRDFAEIKTIQLTRVTIDENFRTSKEGQLYSFTAIKDGEKLRFMIYCDEEFRNYLNGEIKIGAWKSRGMGLVKTKIVKEVSQEDYVRKRSEEISRGFQRIAEILSESGLDGHYGTYTYLTDGTKKIETALRKLGLEMTFQAERVRKIIKYERNGTESLFVSLNAVSAGSAAVFKAKEPESISQNLAELELNIFDFPWFDWVFFNHPVHFEKSVLKG
uniref:CRISPR type III-associated protein domain-containing protein n=1 Tax=Archaeoglobus fulgidus TaxID=2234 RepID=A0A7C3RDZ7_ARCFL